MAPKKQPTKTPDLIQKKVPSFNERHKAMQVEKARMAAQEPKKPNA